MNDSEGTARRQDVTELGAHVALNITKRCNQRCVFCFEGDRATWDEPSLERVQALFRTAAEGHRNVILMGAEALLRPDILDIVRYASGLGVRVSAFTNGQVLARPGFVTALAEAGLNDLQVSFHAADAESFARVTRGPAKGFERLLAGLANVREHNRSNPPLAVTTETELFAANAGRLVSMRALLADVLGESFRSMRLGALAPGPCVGDEPLLESLPERRDELRAFLASHPPDVRIALCKLPLCIAPGYEHLSIDVAYRAAETRVLSNFDDKEQLDRMGDYEGPLRRNPYFWVCRGCSLLPLCWPLRTRWADPALGPRRDQKPIPFRDTRPEDVLARIDGASAAAPAVIAATRARLAAVRSPEGAIVDLLDGLAPAGIEVVDRWVESGFGIDAELRVGGAPLAVMVGPVTRRDRRPASVVGYLAVRRLDGGPADGALATLLDALTERPLPDLEEWRGIEYFDAEAAAVAAGLSAVLGPLLRAGALLADGWQVEGSAPDDSGGLALRLRHVGGLAVGLVLGPSSDATLVEAGGLPIALRPDGPLALDAVPPLTAAVTALVARLGGETNGEDLARAVRRALGHPDAPRPGAPRPSVPAASGFQARPDTLEVIVTDREGRHPPYRLYIGRRAPEDRLAWQLGDVGLSYAPCPDTPVLAICLAVLQRVARALREPPSAVTTPRWERTIHKAFDATPLARRFDCATRRLGGPE